MNVLDVRGNVVELRTKLGEGGEGSVWASPQVTTVAIKTYLKTMPQLQLEKLQAMAKMAEPSLLAVAAWPTRIVYNANRVPVGFEMPKLSNQKPFHDIIGLKSRLKTFPNANWQLLVHAAYNLACAFSGLHAKNIVVGDVNSNNVVVQEDACVLFIDCDSFQITTLGRTYRCEVGVPDYQPPELQNTAFSGTDRLVSHDAFGMAVMIFQLLFVGKHPFTGRLPNPGSTSPTPGENIALGNYFYDDQARQRGLKPPPGSLGIAAVTPTVAKLFERAFRGVALNRPTANEWMIGLKQLEQSIIVCTADSAHRYLKGIACPWCAIELQTKIIYFAAPVLFTKNGHIDDTIWSTFPNSEVERLWKAISATSPPNVNYEASAAERAVPTEISKNVQSKATVFVSILSALIFCAVVFPFLPGFRSYEAVDLLCVFLFWIYGRVNGVQEVTDRRSRLVEAQKMFDNAENAWLHLSNNPDYLHQKQALAASYESLLKQRAVLDKDLNEVKRVGEETAKRKHLDSYFISGARISGIGPQLSNRLAANNIETALDIDDRIHAVSGIGFQKASSLFAWRNNIEAMFRFQPSMIEGLISDVKTKHVRQRIHNRNVLLTGSKALRESSVRIESRAPEIRAFALKARRALDQAEADLRPFSRMIYR